MINSSPEAAIKNIFERAATSLSNTRDQLDKTRKALKKTVLRLSASISSEDIQVNAILNDMKSSVDINIDLNALDSQLDKLFVLTNSSCQKKTSVETDFYSSLKNGLDEIKCSEACMVMVNSFAEKNLTDRQISLEILKLINDATGDNSQS